MKVISENHLVMNYFFDRMLKCMPYISCDIMFSR